MCYYSAQSPFNWKENEFCNQVSTVETQKVKKKKDDVFTFYLITSKSI